MVQLLNTVGAKGMTAVDQYPGNALTHVVLEATELTDVKSARLVVQIHQVDDAHAERLQYYIIMSARNRDGRLLFL